MLVAAYIGFGNSVIRYHLPYVNLRKDKVKVKYIYRREEDRALEGEKEREALYKDYIFTSRLEDILEDPEVNLIVVNTPNTTHVMYAKMALDAGKNVLVEKPIAMNYEETKDLLEYAKEKELTLMPNHNRRFDTDCLAVKDAIASGKLGRLIEIESHYDYFRQEHFLTEPEMVIVSGLGIHTTDQIVSMLGVPKRCQYDVRSVYFDSGADDYFDIDLFYDGMKAIVKTNYLVKTKYPRFIVHGDHGSFIKYGGKHNSDTSYTEPIQVKLEVEDESDWGVMEYVDEQGETHIEKIPSQPTDYGRIYDGLYETIINQAPKLVADEEVLADMKIIEEAMEACI
ncbi:Gfo/Idh/MocA family oxidoreductase [Enterococcus sp. 669A]|uniref:Gfo/Idh/MocA family oxidoreductase n=1 Tax=Candidatus Enterococcus moelleringii TaxID=2815325 RepID=A0ABS3L9F6_9ENTE|nr:Gfo/Idh/MocA family oxidoreductase [Enterococcus sp. 669A]MBO1306263.1 Gfo/Idh/MocA family oxidoreductase [Enterococcus sp. 669A]